MAGAFLLVLLYAITNSRSANIPPHLMKQALEEATATGTDVQEHDPHGIQAVLRQLGIEARNPAFSTGLNWGGAANTKTRTIHSPADGQLIAA